MEKGLWKTPVLLQGNSVRLEPLTEAHIPALTAVGCDDRIWGLMLYGRIRNEADMRVWVRHLLEGQAAGTDLPFAVIQLASGRVAGATRYMEMRPEHKSLEIGGTWYGLEFQRTAVIPSVSICCCGMHSKSWGPSGCSSRRMCGTNAPGVPSSASGQSVREFYATTTFYWMGLYVIWFITVFLTGNGRL